MGTVVVVHQDGRPSPSWCKLPEESPFKAVWAAVPSAPTCTLPQECRRWGRWWSGAIRMDDRHRRGQPVVESPVWRFIGGVPSAPTFRRQSADRRWGGGGRVPSGWMTATVGAAAGGIPSLGGLGSGAVSARLHVQPLGPLVMGALVATTEEAALMGTWMVTFWYPCSSVTLIVVGVGVLVGVGVCAEAVLRPGGVAAGAVGVNVAMVPPLSGPTCCATRGVARRERIAVGTRFHRYCR